MMTKRTEYSLTALMLFGTLAWMFYFGGLWHLLYFSYPTLFFALFVSALGAVLMVRQMKFAHKSEPSVGQQLLTLTLSSVVFTVMLFGATLAILSIPVFLKKATETHIFEFVEWRRGKYRAVSNLKFHCTALVVAESHTYMPSRQHTICIDEFPTPRSRIGSIEVQISELGYVSFIRSAQPHQAKGNQENSAPIKESTSKKTSEALFVEAR